MALLTIRNLDDDVKEGLRVRAAKNKRSMEAEARAILAEALGLRVGFSVESFRKSIKGLEGDLNIPPRSPGRNPPTFD